MTDREFILDTLLDDAIKVARVNSKTGEFICIKESTTPAGENNMTAATIGEYFQNLVAKELVHPDDINSCRYYMDLDFLREKILFSREKLINYFRYKMDTGYIWMMLKIIVPKKLSEENPWMIFYWSEADTDAHIMEDGMKKISGLYHDVLKINLTTDSYMRLGENNSKNAAPQKNSLKISEWFRQLAKSGSIHKGDLQEYLAFTNIEILRKSFLESQESIHLPYRQKVGEIFHWFSMEFIPSGEYTDENQVVMLYIKDIHDDRVIMANFRHKIEYYANFDTLTGIWNHDYFYKRCKEYRQSESKYPVAVMYANINGMREINRKFGLSKGSEYICAFADLLAGEFGKNACYRMSGDEFLILFEHESEKTVKKQFESFQNILSKQQFPMAAIGYVWAKAPNDFECLLNTAENNMLVNKQQYYKKIAFEKAN